ILVARANLNDLPSSVTGTLDLPKEDGEAPTVDLTADPPIGSVDATVVNFIAPDPFVKPIPNRTVSGFGTPTQTITFRQLGTSFKAEAHIQHVRGAGYRTETDANGKPIETKVVRVDFGGQNQ